MNVITACMLVASMLFVSGCKGVEVASRPIDRDITIDGDAGDWSGLLTSAGDGEIHIGVMNNDSTLYLCLVTSDPELVRKAVFMGLTVWFDPEGGRDEYIGITYPTGLMDPHSRMVPPALHERGEEPDPEEEAWRMQSLLAEEHEIIIEGSDVPAPSRLSIPTTGPIRARSELSPDGRFVYEVTVPLGPNRYDYLPFLIDTGPARKIGIGIETRHPTRRKEMDRDGGGFGPPGGMGPPGGSGGFGPPGGGHGGPGGARGGMRREAPKPLELWLTVTLAGPGRD